jgi:rhodanese-related sulfurtransferase
MKHTEAFERLVAEIKPRIREISIDEVRAKQAKKEHFRFIDVREDHEWVEGRAVGAEHIGRGILERDVEKHIPDYAEPIILYCGGGYRYAMAADNIQKMGYTNVLSMAGGMRGWRELNLPEDK